MARTNWANRVTRCGSCALIDAVRSGQTNYRARIGGPVLSIHDAVATLTAKCSCTNNQKE